MSMSRKADEALEVIRGCVGLGRYTLAVHFSERMDHRGMFWADVLAIIDDPTEVRPGGPERFGRPKWILAGVAADGLAVEMVCVLDQDERGDWTVFVTIY